MARPTDAADLSQLSGRKVKCAAGKLTEQDLVHHNQNGIGLSDNGLKCVARRSVAHHQTIVARYRDSHDGQVNLNRNARRHRRQLTCIAINWRKSGIHLELGGRLDFDPGEDDHITPNGWAEVSLPGGSGVLHAVELEGPRPTQDSAQLRVRPFMAAQKTGNPQPLLLILRTPGSESRLLREYPNIWALTTTVSEAMHGPHFGEDSIWRYQGNTCDINHLLRTAPEQDATNHGSSSWVDRILGRTRR